jgi:serralysin
MSLDSPSVATIKLGTAVLHTPVAVLCMVTAFSGVAGCALSHDNATEVEVEYHRKPDAPAELISWEDFKAVASERTAAMDDGTVLYNIEWDLWLTEDELRDRYDGALGAADQDVDKAHAFQQISTGAIPAFTFPNSVNIRYCVSDAFGAGKATWVTAIADAARAWTNAVNVRFTYLSANDAACSASTSAVDFAVVRTDGTGGYCGSNKLGWAVLSGCTTGKGVVEIDTLQDMTFGGAAPNVTVTGALRHELGHVLALRHEHPWRATIDPTCPEAPTIASLDVTGTQLGNIAYDQSSVMHYPFNGVIQGVTKLCGGIPTSDFSLTTADGQSTQRLYGMQPAWVVTITSPAI